MHKANKTKCVYVKYIHLKGKRELIISSDNTKKFSVCYTE